MSNKLSFHIPNAQIKVSIIYIRLNKESTKCISRSGLVRQVPDASSDVGAGLGVVSRPDGVPLSALYFNVVNQKLSLHCIVED